MKMSALLFVFISSVASFGIGIDSPDFFSNPTAFVNSMATADKDTINKLIDFANGLIAEGENVRAQVIKAKNDADAALAEATAALEKAEKYLDKREAIQAEAEKHLDYTTEVEAASLKKKHDAWDVKENKLALYNTAQETMEREHARIAQEEIELNEVSQLLQELMPVLIQSSLGRSLLTDVNAEINPDSLQKVIDLVVDLIKAGKVEANGYTKLRDEAKAAFEKADSEYNAATKQHTHDLGAKSLATDAKNAAVAETKRATGIRDAAANDRVNKLQTAKDAESHRAVEEARINKEKATFEEVIQLLQKLA